MKIKNIEDHQTEKMVAIIGQEAHEVLIRKVQAKEIVKTFLGCLKIIKEE